MASKTLDLDARRAAAAGDGPTVTLGGVEHQLPPALPLDLGVKLTAGDVLGGLELLFGDAAQAVLEAGITEADLRAILSELYGIDLPESPASSASSSTTSRR